MFRRLEELQTMPLSQRVALKLQRLLRQFGREGVAPAGTRDRRDKGLPPGRQRRQASISATDIVARPLRWRKAAVACRLAITSSSQSTRISGTAVISLRV